MVTFRKIYSISFYSLLFSISILSADVKDSDTSSEDEAFRTWSFDIGGQYTWMSFSTPPTYTGSTGGSVGKITYQKPWSFFGQFRTIYNRGTLSASSNSLKDREWYTEFVSGYCFSNSKNWKFTPYVGMGFDFLNDHHTAYSIFPQIELKYRIFYAVMGFETHYSWNNWAFGLQFDCFPTFNEYLKITGMGGSAWTLKQRVGFDVQLPISYKCTDYLRLEVSPYYRLLPIGESTALSLPKRNINQWGSFLTLRFFL